MDAAAAWILAAWSVAMLAAGASLASVLRARLAAPAGTDHPREVFDHLTEGLLLVEVLGEARFRNLALNPALLQSMGMRAEELVGRFVDETAMPEAASAFLQPYRRCVETGEMQSEHVAIHLPGGQRTVELTLVPLRDDAGRIHRLVGIVRDMTNRLMFEAALAAREREFRTLVENSPDLIVRYDRECRRVYVNPAFARLREIPVVHLLGRTPADDLAFDKDTADRLMKTIREVTASGKSRRVSGVLRTSGKRRLVGDVLFVPELDDEGRVQTVLGLGRDVTSERRRQAELEHSRAQLHELAASRISRELHEELGQVLTALRLSAGMLRVQYAESLPPLLAASATMTALVDRAIGTMRGLIRGLRPAALDEGLAAALGGLAADLHRQHGFECRLDLRQEPALDIESARALFGVVQEALDNVVRHAGVDLADVSVDRIGGDWRLVVRDGGRGFDLAAVGAQSYGLQAMKACAQLLAGELQVVSSPAAGTEIRLGFPAGPVKPMADREH